jgi:acetolactate synthase-1/2/3 large subunit
MSRGDGRRVTAGRVVVEVLKAEGVGWVFGLPGGHTLGIYDALYDTPEVRHILVRHEQAAANMAAAYAQLTGEPGVCLATAGPGVTNLISGIAEAYMGALPIVAVCGRGPTATAHRGASQELATDRVVAPVTKWSVRVDRADLLVDVLRQAFTIARSGKPGPVLVEIPWDLVGEEVGWDSYLPAGAPSRPAGDAQRVAAAAELLGGARRPIIVAGGGTVASGALAELRELAELLPAPVLTTLAGRGSIPDDHPLSVGGLGVHRNRLSKRLLAEADVVLGLGCRFEEMETNWKPGFVPSPEAGYVQVDVDPAEIGRGVPAQVGVVGDVRAVLGQLAAAVRERERGPPAGAFRDHPRVKEAVAEMAEIDAEVERLAERDQRPMHPLRVIRSVRAAFPREATVAIDIGAITQHMAGGHPYFRVFEPRSLIVPSSFYGMGFAASALPVARLVHPHRPAVGFVGDGSFQMVLHVLPVAAEHRLPVTWCVLNDRALGSIWDGQRRGFGGRIIATEFQVQPDFARIAEACGCYGERVEDPAGVEAALARALAANAGGVPAVLDFAVARERLPQTLEYASREPSESEAHLSAGSRAPSGAVLERPR